MGDYYEKKDLEDFANIGEYAPRWGNGISTTTAK